MSAFLNITYTFVGQITIPSVSSILFFKFMLLNPSQFIAEMKEPKDFPKALWAVTIAQIIVFTLCGALMYHFIGTFISFPISPILTPHREPIHHIPSIRLPHRNIQKNRILLCDPNHHIPRSTILFHYIQIHLLPHLPQFTPSSLKYPSWMGCLGWYRSRHLGLRVHHRRSHPLLLGSVVSNELPIRSVFPRFVNQIACIELYGFRLLVRIHILGNGIPHALPRSEKMGRSDPFCRNRFKLFLDPSGSLCPRCWNIRASHPLPS